MNKSSDEKKMAYSSTKFNEFRLLSQELQTAIKPRLLAMNSLFEEVGRSFAPQIQSLSLFQRNLKEVLKPTEDMLAHFRKQYDPFLVALNKQFEGYKPQLNALYIAFKEDREFRTAVETIGFSSYLYHDLRFKLHKADENIEDVIYRTVESDSFCSMLIKLISVVPPLDTRADAIMNGICLHKSKNYHAASMVVSSQIEGILLDFLEEQGLAMQKGKVVYKMTACGEYCVNRNKTKVKLGGMKAKAEHAQNSYIELDEFLSTLMSDLLDSSNHINEFRNKLMHGDSEVLATRVESTRLLYWLSGLVFRVCFGLSEDSIVVE